MDSKQACCHMGIDSMICQDQHESLLSLQQVLDQISSSKPPYFGSADEVAFPITVCESKSGSVSGTPQTWLPLATALHPCSASLLSYPPPATGAATSHPFLMEQHKSVLSLKNLEQNWVGSHCAKIKPEQKCLSNDASHHFHLK